MGWLLLLRRLNLDPTVVARLARLPDGLFSRAQGKVTGDQYFKLWSAMEKTFKDPSLPIIVAKSTFESSLNVTVSSTLCSENMIYAVSRLNDYKSLITPLSYQTHKTQDSYSILLKSDIRKSQTPQSLIIAELLMLLELIRNATQQTIVPLAVNTTFPVTEKKLFRDAFGIEVAEGANNSIVFSRKDAERSFATANEHLWNHYEPLMKDKLRSIDQSTRYSSRVKSTLYELLPAGRANLSAVSDHMKISPRTLQRRLKDEGYSFSNLLHTARSEQTMHYLKNTDMALYEVAFLLGFKDQNSFFRAFHQWTGTTPEAARSSLRGTITTASTNA